MKDVPRTPERDESVDPLRYYTSEKIVKDKGNVLKYIIAGAGLIFVFFGATRSGMLDDMYKYLPLEQEVGMLSSSAASFEINVESPNYGVLKSVSMLPWDAVAEPAKTQTISLTKLTIGNSEVDLDDYEIEWELTDDLKFEGVSENFQIDNVGVYTATVQATESKTGKSYSQDFKLAVKYVRREIRSLSDDDRNTFLDALKTLYTLSDDKGKAKYGDKYQTAAYFSFKHLTGAGVSDCDHWHDGAGLISNHMALTLEVEQALQSIDPSISMPYWEYGMDNYLYDKWYDSPMFNSDWFGEANPLNDLHVIDDGGRWAGLMVPDGAPYMDWSMKKTGSLNPYVNAYGHMRSPWNNNPSQYMGRHNMTYSRSIFTIPDCVTLGECFYSTSFTDINFCLNGATHGPVHINIGGAWGEGNIFDNGDLDIIRNPNRLLYFKVLWRMGYTRCPETCEIDDSLDNICDNKNKNRATSANRMNPNAA